MTVRLAILFKELTEIYRHAVMRIATRRTESAASDPLPTNIFVMADVIPRVDMPN